MNNVLVIGSINKDYVFNTSIFPKPGETVNGISFSEYFGGKGANQAVAAARHGANVTFVGAIGNDEVGKSCIENLKTNNIDVSMIKRVDTHTGVASIIVKDGENKIVCVPGANELVIDENFNFKDIITSNYDVVLIQNEIPLASTNLIITICKEKKIPLIYNPAPFIENNMIGEMFGYITPNEHEFSELNSDIFKESDIEIIKTLGSKGALIYKSQTIIDAPKVKSIDTTGAGDCFNGVLASCVAKNLELIDAVSEAVKCASISVQYAGAQGWENND